MILRKLRDQFFFFKICEKIINFDKKNSFIYVGKINEKQKLYIANNFPNSYKRTNFINYVKDSKRIILKSSVVICPSIDEGFGRLPLEAASYGIPCLVSNNAGHKDYINEGFCIRCKTDNIEDFFNKFKKAKKISKKLIIKKVIFFINKNCDLEEHIKKITNLYSELSN